MCRPAVFEDKDALPSAELHPPICHGDALAAAAEDHPDVRSRIISSFGSMDEVVAVFRNETFEVGLEIDPSRAVRVFEDNEAGARMLDEDRYYSGCDLTRANNLRNLRGDIVSPLPGGGNLERFCLSDHIIDLINFS